MNFTVEWLPRAESELAALWMASRDRSAVTSAAAELDSRLELQGAMEGESRGGKRRITFVKPLAILFEVDLPTRKIAVGQVWEFR